MYNLIDYCCNYLRKITKSERNSQLQGVKVEWTKCCNYLRKITKSERNSQLIQ